MRHCQWPHYEIYVCIYVYMVQEYIYTLYMLYFCRITRGFSALIRQAAAITGLRPKPRPIGLNFRCDKTIARVQLQLIEPTIYRCIDRTYFEHILPFIYLWNVNLRNYFMPDADVDVINSMIRAYHEHTHTHTHTHGLMKTLHIFIDRQQSFASHIIHVISENDQRTICTIYTIAEIGNQKFNFFRNIKMFLQSSLFSDHSSR